MSPVFSARRRAEEFDTLINQGAPTAADSPQRELVELAGAMRTLSEPGRRPEPRPEFSTELRANLMAAASSELAPVQTPAAVADQLTVGAPSKREKRLTAAVAGFALVGAGTSMAVASQSALPGETLYPVKRALEGATTGVALNDTQRGHRLLDRATDRLAELEALAAQDELEPGVADDTLAAFRSQADEGAALLLEDVRQGGSEESAQAVLAFAGSGIDRLTDLDREVPEESRPGVVSAADLLFALDAEAKQLCVLCTGGVSEFPAELTSGVSEYAATPQPSEPLVALPAEEEPTESDLPSLEPDTDLPGSVSEVEEPPTDEQGPLGEITDEALPEGQPGTGGSGDPTGPLSPDSLQDAGEELGDTVDDTVNDTTDLVDQVLPGAGTGVQETVDGVEKLLCTASPLLCLDRTQGEKDSDGSGDGSGGDDGLSLLD